MKRFLAIVFSFSFITFSSVAQRMDDSLRYAESIWSMKKKALILDEMHMTEAEKSAFWPVYESYANAIQFLDMEYISLLNVTSDTGLKEKKVESLCEHLLENELLLAKTRKLYYKRFKKALSAAQAGKFMQIDNDFRAMLRLEMQKGSPAFVSSQERIFSRN
jgi:hypothetical protein